jgi:ArsR family transcriptional regulator
MNKRFSLDDSNLKELQYYFQRQESNMERSARCLKILAHPARMKIMCVLQMNECSVQDLGRFTGLPQAPLSQHLSLLKDRGIVTSKRAGNFSIYRIANDQVDKLFDEIRGFSCQLVL